MADTTTSSKSDIDIAFAQFEQEGADNRIIRKEMIDGLRRQLAKAEIYEGDKPMMIQAKLMIYKTLDDLVKSDENASLQKIKMIMTRKADESNGVVGAAVVGLLKEIRAMHNGNDNLAPGPNAEAALEAAAREALARGEEVGLDITEGELEACDNKVGGEEAILLKSESEED